MFRGFMFYIKKGWLYDKYYILWNVLYQVLSVPVPLLSALLPKLILDELIRDNNMQRAYIYVLLLSGGLCLIQILSYLLLTFEK